MQLTIEEITRLTPQDRLALIGQLWDSLDASAVHVTQEQQKELAQRLKSFESDRLDGVSWEVLKADLAKRCP